jgi:tungstate transport system substrate-binding protein
LASDYLSTLAEERSIAWVCNHSRNTQLALLHGYIDVALTYERDQEDLAAAEGWSLTKGCVFHDHFCLAGPLDDPAGVGDAISLSDGLRKIAKSKALFHSRADTSATMWKERRLWSTCNLSPWNESVDRRPDDQWYQTNLLSPSEALRRADAAGAYLLTDRSTLLRQVSSGTVSKTTVFFEPTSERDVLMNSCYALHSPTSSQEALGFLEYLYTDRAQGIIKSYGANECGLPLFAAAEDGFARTPLEGGRPVESRWSFKDTQTS